MADEDIFIVPNPADREKLLHALPRIKFPWGLLRPGLAAQGKPGFTIEFADLSAFTQSTDVDGHEHSDAPQTFVQLDDGHGAGGHIMFGNRVPGLPEESAAAAWGLFWFDGRIQVEKSLMNQQDNIDYVVSAEIAHAVDVFYANGMGMRPAMGQLLSPPVPASQPWFGGTYWDQPGESFMAGFGIAYTDFVQEDPRFRYRYQMDDAAPLRTALRAPRTDEVAPPPPPPPPPAHTLRLVVSDQPHAATIGQRSSGFELRVVDENGALVDISGMVALALLGNIVYAAPPAVSMANGIARVPGQAFSKPHPASENFRYRATMNGMTAETQGFVVADTAPPPPPPPPPPTELVIVAMKTEFTSPHSGVLTVYYSNNTERRVDF